MANLMTRDDTLLGICEGLGSELGVAPNALRVALAAGVLLAPLATIALYGLLGAILAAVRLAWPAPAITPVTADAAGDRAGAANDAVDTLAVAA